MSLSLKALTALEILENEDYNKELLNKLQNIIDRSKFKHYDNDVYNEYLEEELNLEFYEEKYPLFVKKFKELNLKQITKLDDLKKNDEIYIIELQQGYINIASHKEDFWEDEVVISIIKGNVERIFTFSIGYKFTISISDDIIFKIDETSVEEGTLHIIRYYNIDSRISDEYWIGSTRFVGKLYFFKYKI